MLYTLVPFKHFKLDIIGPRQNLDEKTLRNSWVRMLMLLRGEWTVSVNPPPPPPLMMTIKPRGSSQVEDLQRVKRVY